MTPTREWLNAFFEQTDDQFVLIDRDFIIRDTNASVLKELGLPENEVLGAPCYRIFQKKEHPCGKEGDACPLEAVLRTGKPASGVKRLRANHYSYNTHYSAFPLFGEGGEVPFFAMRFQAVSDGEESFTRAVSDGGTGLENFLDTVYELQGKIKEAHSSAEAWRQVVACIKKYFAPDLLAQVIISQKKIKIIQPDLMKKKPASVQSVAWNDFFASGFSSDMLLSKKTDQLDVYGRDVAKIFSEKMIGTFQAQGVDIIRLLFPDNMYGNIIFEIIGWRIPLPEAARNEQFFELFFEVAHFLLNQMLTSEVIQNTNRFLNIMNEITAQMARGSSEKDLVSFIADALLNRFPRLVRVSYLTPDGSGEYWKVQTVKMKPSVQSGLTYLKDRKLIPVDEYNPDRRKVEIIENFDAICSKLLPIQKDLYRGGIREAVRIPLITKNEMMGFLNLGFKQPLEISFPILRYQFEMLGNQLALAITYSRMLAQQEKSKKLWKHVVDSVPLGISVHDANWRVIQINEAVQEALGLPESEIIGEKCYRLFHKMNHPIDTCPYLKLLQSKQPERTIMDVFGDGRQFEVNCYPVFNEERIITGYIHIIEDVTQKLAREKELMQKEKLATLGEIIAGVAHELNNPLTGVLGFADLLLEESGLPDGVREDVSAIKHEAERSSKIVKNLLRFARQTEFHKETLDINFVIEKTIELVEYDLKSKGITFVRKFGKNLPFISGDFYQLQQVFINLITNASQAILSEKKSGTIVFTSRVTDDCVEITVEDDGPGIPPDILGKIFDPFFTTKEVGKGTGLGLSVSFGIVHEHNGRITVRSELKKGTIFTLTFPFLEDSNGFEDSEEKKTSVQNVTGKKILIVDDEEVILSLLQSIYGKAGNQIEVAENGAIALEKLKQHLFDLILIDLRMPEMNGEQFFAHLKEKWPELTSRVIFMTGDAISEETQTFFKKNELPYLIKPFDVDDLKALVFDIVSENHS